MYKKSNALKYFAVVVAAVLGGNFQHVALASDKATAEKKSAPASITVDKVVASIDGDPITESEVKDFEASLGTPLQGDEHMPGKGLGTSTAEQQGPRNEADVVRELIGVKLLEREAEQGGISVSADEIGAYVGEVEKQNGVDEKQFQQLLKERGLSIEQYREQVRREILRARVISQRVRSKVSVSDEDVRNALGERALQKPEEGQVQVEQIYFPLREDASDEEKKQAKEEMDKMEAALKSGEAFRSVGGKYYSDLGFLSLKDLRKELKDALDGASAGNASDVVSTTDGLYILRENEKGDALAGVDEQIREGVRKQLQEKKFQESLQHFLDEELPKKYVIEIKS